MQEKGGKKAVSRWNPLPGTCCAVLLRCCRREPRRSAAVGAAVAGGCISALGCCWGRGARIGAAAFSERWVRGMDEYRGLSPLGLGKWRRVCGGLGLWGVSSKGVDLQGRGAAITHPLVHPLGRVCAALPKCPHKRVRGRCTLRQPRSEAGPRWLVGGWGLSALRSLNWNRAGEWEERWQLGHAGASGLRALSLRTRPGLLRDGGGGKAPGLLPSSSRFPPPQMPTALQHPTYCPQIPSGLLP